MKITNKKCLFVHTHTRLHFLMFLHVLMSTLYLQITQKEVTIMVKIIFLCVCEYILITGFS